MSADTLTALAARLLAERLAKEPDRIEQLVAAAEQAAWVAAQAHLRDTLLVAILEQVTLRAADRPAPASSVSTPVASPVPGQPVPTQPMPGQPEPAQPVPVQPVPVQPVPLQPEPVQPEPVQPEPVQPEPVQPEPVQPEPVQPEPVQPEAPHAGGVGVYVYGIIDAPSLTLPALAGMADGKFVRLYPYRSLAAVVCEVPLDEFGQASIEANLADMAWLERRVRFHQAVLDAVLPLATLLPMKFATIYFDMAGLDNLLGEQFEEFETVLEQLRGHQEWGVKLYIDQALLLEHIDDYSSAVQAMRAEMRSKSQGAAYFLARRLQEVVTEEFERVSFSVADEVHGALAGHSRAALLSPLPPADPNEAERLVLSGVYLVAQPATTQFETAVDELAEEHAGRGFRVEISGPWPAYNFVDLAWLPEVQP